MLIIGAVYARRERTHCHGRRLHHFGHDKPKPWFKRLSLTTWIFIALILGVLAGMALQGAPEIADTYIKPFGTIFLNLIKMIVVPLVLFSIIAGVVSLDDVKKVGAIGGKTVLFYLATTACAVTLGLIFANVMNVGAGYTMPSGELSYEATEPPSLIDTIVNMFPSNFFQPMADATMLQVIVIAVVFGFGMIAAGKKAEPVIKICNAMSDVCIAIMRGIILVAPFGVFGLICPVIANNGIDVLRPLLWLIVVAYLAMICQIVLVYSGIIKVFARMNPLKFLRAPRRWVCRRRSPRSCCRSAPPSTWTALPSTRACAPSSSPRCSASTFLSASS